MMSDAPCRARPPATSLDSLTGVQAMEVQPSPSLGSPQSWGNILSKHQSPGAQGGFASRGIGGHIPGTQP